MTPIAVAALAWLAAINLWTMLRFWQDKRRAIAGVRRIPEADLLRLAIIGGTPGAFAARRMFRHKTRKQPFTARLLSIAAAQAGLAVAGFVIFRSFETSALLSSPPVIPAKAGIQDGAEQPRQSSAR